MLLIASIFFCVLMVTPIQAEASFTTQSSLWCRITSFLGFTFCDTDTVTVLEAPGAETQTQEKPIPEVVPVAQISTTSPKTGATTTSLKDNTVTNTYITTNPTTIIREVVRETVSTEGVSTPIDTSNFVTKDFFRAQSNRTQDSGGRSVRTLSNNLKEVVSTDELTVTGNGTVSGTFVTTNVLSSLTSVSAPYFSATSDTATSPHSSAHSLWAPVPHTQP